MTPGIFAEYSLKYEDMLSLVAGIRADYSTRYGFFVTPRANIRYTPFEWWTLRASAGMGTAFAQGDQIAEKPFVTNTEGRQHGLGPIYVRSSALQSSVGS